MTACPFCARSHAPERYECSSCRQKFSCATQFSTAFGLWAHRRSSGNLVFGPDGSGPWPESNDEELTCGPVIISVGPAVLS